MKIMKYNEKWMKIMKIMKIMNNEIKWIMKNEIIIMKWNDNNENNDK